MRLLMENLFVMIVIFQSTHPLRDATNSQIQAPYTCLISIHAPLTGCDVNRFASFNNFINISIHAPLTGCDLLVIDEAQEYTDISIHAPLTGCDKLFLARVPTD